MTRRGRGRGKKLQVSRGKRPVILAACSSSLIAILMNLLVDPVL